jgi:nucleoside-diphosphate-sugar epimerase
MNQCGLFIFNVQFLHASDCAAALGALLRNDAFSQLPFSLDLSTGVWVTLRSLADQVRAIGAERTGRECEIRFSDKKVFCPFAVFAVFFHHGLVIFPSAIGSSNDFFLYIFSQAVVRTRLAPRLNLPFHISWHSDVSLEQGIRGMFEYYLQESQQPQIPSLA